MSEYTAASLAVADQLVPAYDQAIRKFLRDHASTPLEDRARAWHEIGAEMYALLHQGVPGQLAVVFLATSALLRLLEKERAK